MSASHFVPNPQKRRWNGQRRSQITDADLANYGLAGMSQDRAQQIATGLPPGAKRLVPTATFPPAKPAVPAARSGSKVTGNAKLWTSLQTATSGETTKTTRARQIAGGVILNTCTRGPAGIAEALVFIPGATLADFA
jgi:hypothetical protein